MIFESFGFVELPENKYKELFIKSLGVLMEECASCPNIKHIDNMNFEAYETITEEVCSNSKCPIRDILIEAGIAHPSNDLSNNTSREMCDGVSIEMDADTEVNDDEIKAYAMNRSNIYIEEPTSTCNKLHLLGKLVLDEVSDFDDDHNDDISSDDDNCECNK